MPRLLDETGPLPNINNRFGENNFRRFERIFAQLVKEFPAAVVVSPPKHLTLSTLEGRMRDAARAFLHPDCEWEAAVQQHEFREVWKQVALEQQRDGKLYVGLKRFSERELQATVRSETNIGIMQTMSVDALDHELLRAVMLCKSEGFIPSQLLVVNGTESIINALAIEFPAAPINETPEGWVIL